MSDAPTRPPRFRHIACCVDDSPSAAPALERARDLCEVGTRLSVVHVAPRPLLFEEVDGALVPSPADITVARRRRLEALVRRTPGATGVVLEGLPGPAICAWAAASEVDLIVAAAHDHGLWRMAALGSVTRHLVDHAPCPVLVLRGPGPDPRPEG